MYISRTLEQTILKADKTFYVILLTGPRQTGKTTLLKAIQNKNRSYISFDNIDVRISAQKDPESFIDNLKLPVLIDEIQYAPEIFPYIKMVVDKLKKPGLFWLTGSQQFSMMKNVSESLAGRVAILNLYGISLAEENKQANTPPFIPTMRVLKKRQQTHSPIILKDIYKKIWRGSYPQVVVNKGKNWQIFYESYISSYIDRDIRDFLQSNKIIPFRKFLQIIATRTGQKINYYKISKEVGVSEPSIKSWVNILQMSGLIILVYPYFKNITKRLVKTPKFYFMDTGLCCYLTGWLNPVVLSSGAMAGALLENYVIVEIIKSYIHNGQLQPFYYYTDKEQNEIDLIIEQSGNIHPIEIKKSNTIQNMNFKAWSFLKKLPVGEGCVLCFTKHLLSIHRHPKITAVPIGYL